MVSATPGTFTSYFNPRASSIARRAVSPGSISHAHRAAATTESCGSRTPRHCAKERNAANSCKRITIASVTLTLGTRKYFKTFYRFYLNALSLQVQPQ